LRQSAVPRFLLHAVVSVTVVVGMGLFDVAAKLRAGPITYPQLSLGVADEFAPYFGAASLWSEPEALPPKRDERRPLDSGLLTAWCTHSSGAGPQASSPTSSTSRMNAYAGSFSQENREPQLIAFLCAQQDENIPDPIPSSIFHPPRPRARG
jgi:hypothetical protein